MVAVIEAGIVDGLAQHVVGRAEGRVDGDLDDLVRLGGRHLLDVDAAQGAEHQHKALAAAVVHDAGIVLRGDGQGRLDEHLLDGQSLDVHVQDARCGLTGLLGPRGHLHAAGLPAPADVDLRLDNHAPEAPRGLFHRGGRGRHHARGHGQAHSAKKLFALIFVQLHRTSYISHQPSADG